MDSTQTRIARSGQAPEGSSPAAGEAHRLSGWLIRSALGLGGFLLALVVTASLGGMLQNSISPLVRVWPWLLAPARALFGPALVQSTLLPERGWPTLALFAMLLVGATALVTLTVQRALHEPRAGRRQLAVVLAATTLLGLVLVVLPSLPSDDVFSYILYGRIAVIHHANPLVAVPSDFPSDPFLFPVFWRDTRSVYGPVWLLLSQGLSLLAERLGGSLATYTLLFKLLGLVAHLANSALVWLILGRLAPRRRLFSTLFYAWNPLCLLEFCASAHNDAVMLFFLLLGVYALLREWEVVALVCWSLSISTKYVPLALLPFYLVYVARRMAAEGAGRRAVLAAIGWRLGLVVGGMVLVALPYWSGPRMLGALLYSPPAQQLNNSFADGIKWPLRALVAALPGMTYAMARGLADNALKLIGLLAFVSLWLIEFRRTRSVQGVLAAWGWVLLWYIVVASGWFWPWYVTWLVALVALVPWGRLTVATLLLTGGSLALYAFLPLHSSPIYGYRSFVTFGPVVGYLLWQGRDWWRTFAPAAVAARPSSVRRWLTLVAARLT